METVGRLARRFGLSRSTLLYYDRIGLLCPSGHAKGEYRRYSEADVARLARICSLREAGLPLERIARVLDGPETALGQALEARLDELSGEMRALRDQQRLILGLLGSENLPADGLKDRATWTALLRDAGFSEEDMRRWHADFERRSPEGHLRFLRLLCLPKDEIDLIRAWAASPLRIEHLRKASQHHMEELFRFFEGLERKGPGGEAETLAALDLARAAAPERLGAGRAPNILDIGCGAGLHTRLLARETGGRVLATDIHRPYLDELVAAAQREGVADRITPLVCDMNVLADAPEVRARAPFDCIWAEGSVFVVGLERALGMLPGLLAPGGIFACTDAAWRRDPDDPAHPAPAEVRAYAAEVFPDMPTEEGGLAMARRHGWEPVGHFLLDARCWRDYYRGYTERLPGFLAEAEARAAETGDPAPLQAARTLAGELTHEMAMFETYSDWYTYLFLILRRA